MLIYYEKYYYRTYHKSYGQRSARTAISTANPLLPTALQLTYLYQNDDSEYPGRRLIQRSPRLGCGARIFTYAYENRIVSHMSRSVLEWELSTYLPIVEMLRTRAFYQYAITPQTYQVTFHYENDLSVSRSSIPAH